MIYDKELYVENLKEVYIGKNKQGIPLNDVTRKLISESINRNNIYSGANGLPGTHAEIRTYNYITTKFPEIDNSKITIATVRADTGDDFKACTSCTSILPKEVNILTGTTPPLPKGSTQPDPSKFIREE